MAVGAHSPTFRKGFNTYWQLSMSNDWTGKCALTSVALLWMLGGVRALIKVFSLNFLLWLHGFLPAAAGREHVCWSGLLVWSSESLELKISHLCHCNLTADFKSLLVSLKTWLDCLIWNCVLYKSFIILHVIFRLVKLHVNCKTDVKIPSENDNSQPNINLGITAVLFMPLVGYLRRWWLIDLGVMVF